MERKDDCAEGCGVWKNVVHGGFLPSGCFGIGFSQRVHCRADGDQVAGVGLQFATLPSRHCGLVHANLGSDCRLREAEAFAFCGDVHNTDTYMRIRMTPQTLLCVGALETSRAMAYRRDMADDLSTRIQSLRRKLGKNQAQFGELLGVNQATVSRWEKGSIPDGVLLKKIAELGGVDINTLIDGDMQAAKNGPQLYIKGEVAAGVWREAFEWDQGDWIPYQGGSHFDAPNEARFGLRVIGESMNDVYPPGTVLDCVATIHADIRSYQSGQRVIVCRKRWSGEVEATVKELLFDGDQVWLLPKSRNPAFQTPILLNGPDKDIEETCIVAVVKGSYRPE